MFHQTIQLYCFIGQLGDNIAVDKKLSRLDLNLFPLWKSYLQLNFILNKVCGLLTLFR